MKNLLVMLIIPVALGGCGTNDLGNPSLDGSTGGTGGTTPFTCESLIAPPEGCGSACGGDFACNAGLFCTNGSCIASCGTDDPCPDGERCTSRGRCVEIPQDGGTGDGATCIDDEVTPTRIVPNIMYFVDRSGSMAWALDGNNNPPAGQSRWTIAHDAIITVSNEVEDIVRLGLTTYRNPSGPVCPELGVNVNFALNNASTISSNYSDNPNSAGGNTPTGDSIDQLVGVIEGNPPPADGPTIIVLATDGEPDTCEQPNPNQGQEEALTAAEKAYLAGIQTFVLAVGDEDVPAFVAHLQMMANVGIGLARNEPPATQAQFWEGTTPELLEDAFRTIIADQISCEVPLNGVVEDFNRVCEGAVELDGESVACVHGQSCTPGPGSNCDGWRIKDGTDDTLELVGQACQDWKEGAEGLTAVFPCGIIVVE